ncbi:hypothetical protein H6F42_12270 [Pseudanabaena sp. FACHB-1998]|uniref:hypothetical protein n=1 Tax=Pseudanabaena sp. FACHB-1998 TaxID=2692858 RepID=UPI0016809253|nr:hypothetical protein [Pseudanabaena sp. FACHB-1998]MBD2177690.1 hypothetical protein [Pseudanabaena sp. FACHB-1998]
MTQFKAHSVKIGSAAAIFLWIFAGQNDVFGQNFAQNIPIDPGKIPDQIQQNLPVIPQEPPKVDQQSNTLKPEQINEVVNFAISTTSARYPWLTNPTDRLTFPPTIFSPNNSESYLDSDIRFASKNPVVIKLTYGYFPKSDQFYWVLPNNEIAIETQGYQAGILHQGDGTDISFNSTITFSRALTGTQVVTSLPENFPLITNNLDPRTLSVQSTAAEAVNPPGIPAPNITINSGFDLNRPNVTLIGTGSTNNPQGGSSNFGNLEAQNTPQVIQGFPTVNLQALFDNGAIPLALDSVVSPSGLDALGLAFNISSNSQSAKSKLGGFTSLPGVKILQDGKFDNFDLLQILTNPNLKKGEKQFYYLNSLFWSDLGARNPTVQTTTQTSFSSWERIYASRPVNQSLITYDKEEIKASYSNRFVNIGASLTYSFDRGKVDGAQSLNSTVGMLLGSTFLGIAPNNIQDRIDEAKRLRDSQAKFNSLSTKSTSEQRQQINQRLNSNLFYSNLSSALEQISGNITVSSDIRPTSSDIFQVRTGLYRRAVQFIDQEINDIVFGDTVVSELRTNFQDFGPLTFIGTLIPRNETGFQPSSAFASEIILTAPDGRQFVQNINSSNPIFATIPAGIKRLVLAFDRIELTQKATQSGKFSSYLGYISLPSIEANWSGSVDNFNYGISSGLWFNLSPNKAGNVSNNTLGNPEPSLGAFVNAVLSWSSSSVELDESKKIATAITTGSPVLRLNWNSSINNNNAGTLIFSYTYGRQGQGMNISLTPGTGLVLQGSNLRTIGFLQGSLDMMGGTRFRGSLEYDQNFNWSLEATQALNSIWTAGLFIKNFRDINQGIDSREQSSVFGVLFRYQIPQSLAAIEMQLGTGGSGIDFRIKGNLRW